MKRATWRIARPVLENCDVDGFIAAILAPRFPSSCAWFTARYGCVVEVGAGSGELGCQLLGLGDRPPAGEIAADEGGSSAAHRETAVQQIQHARLGVPERQNPVRLE